MNVTVARVYLSESAHDYKDILRMLHDEEGVRGATVFRGISGFGSSGKIRTASLIDLSLDLPIVIEFFDEPERVEAVLQRLRALIEPWHVLTFGARLS